jgi:flagellar hook-associated protein 3 FlgL
MIRFTHNLSSLQASLLRRRTSMSLTAQMGAAEQEVATGRKADVYGALGLRSARVIDLRASIERTDGFITANTQLQNRLDTMAETLKTVRLSAQSVLALAASNREQPTQTAIELQMSARAALDTIVGMLNSNYQGAMLFGGVETGTLPMQPWENPSPDSGMSPKEVMEAIIGNGLNNAANSASKAAKVTAAFANTSTKPAWNFDATFYHGAPQSAQHLTARIDETMTLDYGVQANDPSYASLLQGLSMLAAIDVSKIADEGAYQAWTSVAVDALSVGVTGALDAETQLGTRQARLAEVVDAQKSRQDIYKSQVVDLEGVDTYEAASRINILESQLQASYAVSARLANLSFLNFMR